MAERTCIREHGHISVNRARTGQEHDPCRESASSWILELQSLPPSLGLSVSPSTRVSATLAQEDAPAELSLGARLFLFLETGRQERKAV